MSYFIFGLFYLTSCLMLTIERYLSFPDRLAGKESACKAGDPGSIPGMGSSSEEVIGYPLQYFWASLVAQMVKNPNSMQETWVQSLIWENSLEEGMATHSSALSWRIPWTEEPGGLQSGVTKSQTWQRLTLSLSLSIKVLTTFINKDDWRMWWSIIFHCWSVLHSMNIWKFIDIWVDEYLHCF